MPENKQSINESAENKKTWQDRGGSEKINLSDGTGERWFWKIFADLFSYNPTKLSSNEAAEMSICGRSFLLCKNEMNACQ